MVLKAIDSFLPRIEGAAIPRGAAADVVFEAMCAALVSGELGPGMTVHDATIAEHLGISRTPVREAIQRLRMLGVIESAANRHTRIVDVSPVRTEQALHTWTGLFQVLCEEVIPRADAGIVASLVEQHAAFGAARAAADDIGMARTNFAFYAVPLPLSRNPVLVDALRRVVFVIRLGGLSLPDHIDVDTVERAQLGVVEAFRQGDPAPAAAAMLALRHLRIPREETRSGG
ncbi:GntR family transcriptional regulator [Herbiconiux sp. KACC 21604]|uniref:GntR family transcriptional regulator n=1 Tax=unclassified Herbiconiux TaxID=2618217 RepID=UPI0014928530|nr:GntR family transcriptional regulator [Herbiconiux sp. SALV-R1]QJU55632.1 GntR family transcriptional regulator [Herbiconiux sp. SALV-R1]WPO86829.1 GntR family transcriptional regulator [Herbiconiux sp. KACC 21604]